LLTTKHGVEAKSYEGLGDANKLKPLEVELKRLEDLSESIVQVKVNRYFMEKLLSKNCT
jgi:hypothetical protein